MLTPNSNGWYTTRTISVSLHDCEYIVHLNKGHIEDGYSDDEREDNIECVHLIECVGFGILYDWMRDENTDPLREVHDIMRVLNFGQLDSNAFTPDLAYGEKEGH